MKAYFLSAVLGYLVATLAYLSGALGQFASIIAFKEFLMVPAPLFAGSCALAVALGRNIAARAPRWPRTACFSAVALLVPMAWGSVQARHGAFGSEDAKAVFLVFGTIWLFTILVAIAADWIAPNKSSGRAPARHLTGARRSAQTLERMKEKTSKRPVSATILAIILGWLGIAGLFNAVVWPLVRSSKLMSSAPPEFIARFPPALGSVWFSLLALAYGISALYAARALWRLAPSAAVSYSVWALTVLLLFALLFVMTPEASIAAVGVFLLPVIALLAAGWLFTRRVV